MLNDAHSRPTGDTPGPLYDVNIPTPTHAERARTLVSQVTTGTLCTLAAEPAGFPYGSFVTVAFEQGNPVFLFSALAEHTRNLQQDSRGSLLVAETGAEDPLANGRVTLLGPCRKVSSQGSSVRSAFLETHPNAKYYADFKDFAFWCLQVESIRYIGGYGRMSWVDAPDWHAAEADPLAVERCRFVGGFGHMSWVDAADYAAAEVDPVAGSADEVIAHMNQDHAEAMVLFCKAFSKATEVTAATMTGVDRYGFEMSAITAEGARPIRLAFADMVTTADDVRAALIAMLQEARAKLG